MAASHHFRTAFRGFNREDVVHYIEYMNNQHNAQLAQLRAQLQPADQSLAARLEEAEARCAQLEAALAQYEAQEPAPISSTDEELEAYRRAERAERTANERAGQIYAQAHAVLADVTLKAEAAAEQYAAISRQICDQMALYQASVDNTGKTLQEAVATLYAIRPEDV